MSLASVAVAETRVVLNRTPPSNLIFGMLCGTARLPRLKRISALFLLQSPAMKLTSVILSLFVFLGCQQDPQGIAIVNRSDRSLSNVTISSGDWERDVFRVSLSSLPAAGFANFPFDCHLGKAITINCTVEGGAARSETIPVDRRPESSEFMTFEFSSDYTWKFRMVKRVDIDSFLGTR